jgi:hypothetical protein
MFVATRSVAEVLTPETQTIAPGPEPLCETAVLQGEESADILLSLLKISHDRADQPGPNAVGEGSDLPERPDDGHESA